MDTRQINDALDRIFHEEDARIVFWNDPEKEFQNVLWLLDLAGVEKIELSRPSRFAATRRRIVRMCSGV